MEGVERGVGPLDLYRVLQKAQKVQNKGGKTLEGERVSKFVGTTAAKNRQTTTTGEKER